MKRTKEKSDMSAGYIYDNCMCNIYFTFSYEQLSIFLQKFIILYSNK